MRARKTTRGFTLIELLIIMVLMSIFAMFALPAFTKMVNNSRVQSSAAELKSMLLAARSDAVTKRSPVTIERTAADAQVWTATQGGQIVRTVTLPATVVVNPSVTTITFQPNGTAIAAAIGVASSSAESAYAITVTQVGLIKSAKSITETGSE
jgi:prepilin-type N-terminal cleavage/methylation domain-containing protein